MMFTKPKFEGDKWFKFNYIKLGHLMSNSIRFNEIYACGVYRMWYDIPYIHNPREFSTHVGICI